LNNLPQFRCRQQRIGENSSRFRAISTSSDRDASLSRPSTSQSTHEQDIPSFSSCQTYLQMLTKSAQPGSKSSTSSTILSHNQDMKNPQEAEKAHMSPLKAPRNGRQRAEKVHMLILGIPTLSSFSLQAPRNLVVYRQSLLTTDNRSKKIEILIGANSSKVSSSTCSVRPSNKAEEESNMKVCRQIRRTRW
jgi:hypothetical protein